MRDILPAHVMSVLHDRFVAGVADAEARYGLHAADEDSVSGALGQSIAMQYPVQYSGPEGTYQVKITYKKIRGRGPGAPERRYGADGLFQIVVTDSLGTTVRQKALPYQAKMNWKGRNKGLFEQAVQMQSRFDGGIVVNFTPDGYKVASAHAVVAGNGSLTQVERLGAIHSLGQVLGQDFLECTIGTIGLFFDPQQEIFLNRDILPPVHLITAAIAQVRE